MAEDVLKISNILTMLLSESRLSEAELSRKIGVPRATVNRLISGRTPDPRASTLEAIAEHFQITIDQLLGKRPLLNESNQRVKVSERKVVPIINWKDAKNWRQTVNLLNLSNHADWVTIDFSDNNELLGLIFSGDSMSPQFQENTLLIFDVGVTAKNRDFVIAHIGHSDEILFRQIIIEGKYMLLKAVNPIFPSIKLGDEDKIIGTLVQSRKNYF
jgi:SOS-response transcriptional repressor LexA